MKRILITGAGGVPSLNFTRSLRLAPESFYLVGVDSNKYYLSRAETDARHLIPKASEDDYIDVLQQIIGETGAQMVFAQPDVEIAALSANRHRLGALTFLPRHETVITCQDKFASYRRWQEADLRVPDTRLLTSPAELKAMFSKYGELWIRCTHGAAGRGAFYAKSLEEARVWIDFSSGWGSFTAAQYLSRHSVTWQSIWKEGELVVAQGRRRLYWEFADRAPSGVTGITGTGVTVADPEVDEVAQRAVLAIDPEPHGIFSVDLTYDAEGIPNLTEINIGRFFTTHLFFTIAGLNMPYIVVKLAYGERPPPFVKKLNPLPSGLAWVRGMDMEPILTDLETIEGYQRQLEQRRAACPRA